MKRTARTYFRKADFQGEEDDNKPMYVYVYVECLEFWIFCNISLFIYSWYIDILWKTQFNLKHVK